MIDSVLNDAHLTVPVFLAILIVLLSLVMLRKKDEGVDISVALKQEEALTTDTSTTTKNASGDERILHPVKFQPFRLVKATKTSYNTKLLRFEIPNGRSVGLPIGRHLSVMAVIDGNKGCW